VLPDRSGNPLAACPRCGHADAILSVPAAYHSARATEWAGHVARDDDASISRRHAARMAVNAALPVVPARELAVAPGNDEVVGYGCLGIVLGGVAIIMIVVYGATSSGSGAWLLLVVGFVTGLVCLLSLLQIPAAVARRQLVKAGRPAATAVWQLGWYCCRCAIVYFQIGEAPPGVAPGQPLTPAQFQHIVWTVGGYAKTPPPPAFGAGRR